MCCKILCYQTAYEKIFFQLFTAKHFMKLFFVVSHEYETFQQQTHFLIYSTIFHIVLQLVNEPLSSALTMDKNNINEKQY